MGTTLIKAKITDQTLEFTLKPMVASGGVNEDVIEFEFDELWDGFDALAVFYRSKRDVFHKKIVDNKCTVPSEVLRAQGVFYVGVMGVKDNVTRTTNVLRYELEHGAITVGVEPPEPTPSIYESIRTALGYTPVKDVQVAGNSVLVDGVANVPIASEAKEGVIKAPFEDGTSGIQLGNDNRPCVFAASEADITARQTLYRPLVPARIDYAVKAAMCDGKGAAWTSAEQKAARERIEIAGFAEMNHITTLVTEEETNVLIVDLGKQCRICRFYYEFPETISTGYTYVQVSNTNTVYYNMSGCAISTRKYLDYIRIASALKPISIFALASYLGNEATAQLLYSMPMEYAMDETTGFRYLKFTTYQMKFPKNTTIEVYAV